MRYTLSFLTLFLSLVVFAASANAATYYIAPSGSDGSAGSSVSTPWKTFAYAIPRLNPGDTLILKDGTYTGANSGYPSIDCNVNASNGTASSPITIRAENERRAYINNDGGSTDVFRIYNCSYWTVDGLRMSRADNSIDPNSDFMVVGYSDHITVKNNLFHNANRYNNEGPILAYYTNDSLFEKNEFYWFHRHGITTKYGSNNTFRRNYCNSRNYADIPDTYHVSINTSRGDTCISIYPGSGMTLENNISEGNDKVADIEAVSASNNNHMHGNISLNDGFGILTNWRALGAHNTVSSNNVAINPLNYAFSWRSTENTQSTNDTAIGAGTYGFYVDVENAADPSTPFSFSCTNCLALNSGTHGMHVQEQDSWSVGYSNAYNNSSANFSPNDANVTNSTQIDPQLGSCRVFIPDSSPMKGAGKNGADIGANVLYAYENGVLTNKPLWDTSVDNGRFIGCGAIIPGVNDIAGQSCFDVHKRLNVNYNGCSLPAGYGGAQASNGGNPDLNADGVVNSLDWSVMNSQWGLDGTADLNGDNVVNSLDFSILNSNWSG